MMCDLFYDLLKFNFPRFTSCTMEDFGYGNSDFNARPRENYMRREVDIDQLWENSIHSGINFSKYDSIKVTVDGENKPEPVAKFSEAGLCALLASNVKRAKYEA